MITVTVEKATASENGGFVCTLATEKVVKTVLGNSTRKQKYLFKCEEDITGLIVDIDLNDFDVREISWSTDEGEKRISTWLYPKLS